VSGKIAFRAPPEKLKPRAKKERSREKSQAFA